MSTMYSLAAVAAVYIGMWFTFKKMNLPGWKGIIPFYNYYVLFEKLWDIKMFWRMVIYTAVGAGSAIFGSLFITLGAVFAAGGNAQPVGIILLILGAASLIASLVLIILLIVLEFQLFVRMAAAFALKRAWAWGMLFIPYVIFPIIGFHKGIVYYGPVQQTYNAQNQTYYVR
ncbi:MAG: hypothetical protein IJG87_07915 [Ruminococcus sp.]|nr:hypothetical protein [Ruminococcus sp.]